MKHLYHRIRYFFDLWRTDDPWSPVPAAKIDAAFAWDLAGAKASVHDELSNWEPFDHPAPGAGQG